MKSIIKTGFILVFLLLVVTGCQYDINSVPPYSPDFDYSEGPSITQIDPAAATPGYNTITIMGTNFGETMDDNRVYFSGYPVETLDATTTSITVRRPNLVADDLTVKVVAYNAYTIAEFSPYQIDAVFSDVGNFMEFKPLNAVVSDGDDNVYIVQKTPRVIWKVTPDGTKSEFAAPSKIAYDARIAPDNKLALFCAHKQILLIDMNTGEETKGKEAGGKMNTGDFDQNGNIYGGGEKSDLYIISQSGGKGATGLYKGYGIKCLRVYDGIVYLLAENLRAKEGDVVTGIWKHEILDADGNLGPQELVLDWSLTGGGYAESIPTYFTIGQDGTFYITTDNENPIKMFNINTGKEDILYKDILTPPYDYIGWGNTDMFVIHGGEVLRCVRIGMGGPGAPYIGSTL